jgi:hypothetical protein
VHERHECPVCCTCANRYLQLAVLEQSVDLSYCLIPQQSTAFVSLLCVHTLLSYICVPPSHRGLGATAEMVRSDEVFRHFAKSHTHSAHAHAHKHNSSSNLTHVRQSQLNMMYVSMSMRWCVQFVYE